MKSELLRIDHLEKKENNSLVLHDVCITVFHGEVMGLLPMEPTGMVQLLHLMCVNESIDFGNVFFDNRLVNTYKHSDNGRNPVHIMGRERCLAGEATVAENLFLFRQGQRLVLLHKAVIQREADVVLAEYGVSFPSCAYVKTLSPCQQSMAEIIKAHMRGDRLVILHEPESYLGDNELDQFLTFIQRLTKLGMSFVYVSSNREKMIKFCDRIAVFSRGTITRILDRSHMEEGQLNPFPGHLPRAVQTSGDKTRRPILSFSNVETNYLHCFSLDIGRGQCVVLADEAGHVSGHILSLLCADVSPFSGQVSVDGIPVHPGRQIRRLLKKHMAIIQENPIQSMLCPELSYLDNLCLQMDLRRNAKLIQNRVMVSITREYEQVLGRNAGAKNLNDLYITSLYDLIYYRVLLMRPSLVVINQPYTGCDIALQSHIHELIRMFKSNGIAILILTRFMADKVFLADSLCYWNNSEFVIPAAAPVPDGSETDRGQ